MEQQETKKVYFKRNVPYTLSVRFNSQDTQGFLLNAVQPWIAVPVDKVNDFKMANRRFIMDGIILETEEPNVNWATPNALENEDIDELLKNYLKLKATVAEVDSASILIKILERAKEQNKSAKITTLIQDRLDELVVNEGVITPREMQGVS